MNKQELKILENVFSSEINSALNKGIHLYQTKSNIAKKLLDDGMLSFRTIKLLGTPPCSISGYELTHAGRMAYCMTCTDDGLNR